MNEQRVTKEQAIRLKEAGFDWEVNQYYNKDREPLKRLDEVNMNDTYYNRYGCVSAPTLSQCCKWLRDVKGWHVVAVASQHFDAWRSIYAKKGVENNFRSAVDFETYDLAISDCIDAVLEQIEKEVQND